MIDLLVLGTADWQQAIATNQHYIVRELAQRYNVTFVESIGLRRPELRFRDIRRIVLRLAGRRSPQGGQRRPVPDGVRVISPLLIPLHIRSTRWINRVLLRHALRGWLRQDELPRVLWTYTPVTYGLETAADATIYHCVDLLGEVQGISGSLIARSEADLARYCDAAAGSSEIVADHLRRCGFRNVQYWPNVADIRAIEAGRPEEVQREKTRVVFAGNLTPTKVDFPLMQAVVSAGFELHLAGPLAEGGGTSSESLASLVQAGAIYHGHLSLDALGKLYWGAVVGLVPYLLNSYTYGVSPLKTYEYLAAGCAVVSTAIPSIQRREPDIFVTSDHQAFLDAVARAATACGETDQDRRRALARAHSWEIRGEEARSLAAQLLTN